MSYPIFTKISTNPFGLSDVGRYASPTFVDIDNDGDLDAFVGDSVGRTSFFQNTGTTSSPVFAAVNINPFGLSNVSGTANPALVDIDDDDDLDDEEDDWDPDFEEFDLPKSKGKKAVGGGKKAADEEEDFKVEDDEFKDLFNDDAGFDDEEEDF